jgi:acyl-CoA synthetase (AMP-forming)/AMP-acid ligase II
LQVSGPVVFDHYFNDAEAPTNAFSADGWFVTGDLARIDISGNLILVGRTKDLIAINGINWSSTDIEKAIEEEGIAGLVPTFTVAFAHRAADSPTEDLAIVYSPAYAPGDDKARFETAAHITKIVALNYRLEASSLDTASSADARKIFFGQDLAQQSPCSAGEKRI